MTQAFMGKLEPHGEPTIEAHVNAPRDEKQGFACGKCEEQRILATLVPK